MVNNNYKSTILRQSFDWYNSYLECLNKVKYLKPAYRSTIYKIFIKY